MFQMEILLRAGSLYAQGDCVMVGKSLYAQADCVMVGKSF